MSQAHRLQLCQTLITATHSSLHSVFWEMAPESAALEGVSGVIEMSMLTSLCSQQTGDLLVCYVSYLGRTIQIIICELSQLSSWRWGETGWSSLELVLRVMARLFQRYVNIIHINEYKELIWQQIGGGEQQTRFRIVSLFFPCFE